MHASDAHLLIVEDDANIAEPLRIAIEAENFHCTSVATGRDAMQLIDSESFDLILLDVGLPDINGFDLIKALREVCKTPVIFLTARHEEIDRVVGLELGADDYVSKPFSPRELIARIRAVLRRSHPPTTTRHPESKPVDFRADSDQARIYYRDKPLDLTAAEYKLLSGMLEQPNRVFSRQQLLDIVWQAPHPSDERTIDTHIKTIRAKLRDASIERDPINTHRGLGYSITP